MISEVNDPLKEVKVRFMRKSGQYSLLRRATLLSQPEMERFILWVTMLLFAQKQLIGSCA